ncbi:hypothetical protein ACTWPT_45335 [Nonomuraea sp. 3N208]|uniref:hypothetical protein n=1 Tax=Nonomuraea sp. 3N208 TaxID=3457421 RepID=UPI003FD5F718
MKIRHEAAYLSGPRQEGYFVRPPWRSLYSARFETPLVSVTCDDGTTGWGEALAPVAPKCRPPSSTGCSPRR